MKRTPSKPRRFLFNALAAMSLLLAMTASAALLVSRRGNLVLLWAFETKSDTPSGNPRQTTIFVGTSRHRAFFGIDNGDPNDFTPGAHVVRGNKNIGTERWIDWEWNPLDLRIVTFPGWLITIGLCGLSWLIHRKSRDGQRTGVCLSCGYDLRATPQRCPECGWIANELEAV